MQYKDDKNANKNYNLLILTIEKQFFIYLNLKEQRDIENKSHFEEPFVSEQVALYRINHLKRRRSLLDNTAIGSIELFSLIKILPI